MDTSLMSLSEPLSLSLDEWDQKRDLASLLPPSPIIRPAGRPEALCRVHGYAWYKYFAVEPHGLLLLEEAHLTWF